MVEVVSVFCSSFRSKIEVNKPKNTWKWTLSAIKSCNKTYCSLKRHYTSRVTPPKRTLVDSVSDCYSCKRRHLRSSPSKLQTRLGYNVPLLGTDCDLSQSCTTPVIASVKMDGIRHHNNVKTILQWPVRWPRNWVSVCPVQIKHAIL